MYSEERGARKDDLVCAPWKGEQGGLGVCSLERGAGRTWFVFPGKGSGEDLVCVPWKGEQGGLGSVFPIEGAERTWFCCVPTYFH